MSMPRRIVIFGPESTGKSTLTARLAAHFNAPWAVEYVRTYWDEHDGRIGPEDLGAIARGQVEGEERAAGDAGLVYFVDTDLLTCVLYNDLLFPGACPAWVRDEAEERARATTLYLFCDTDLPWENDPQRSFPDIKDRERIRRIWLEALQSRALPHVRIHGDWEEREARAIATVEAMLE